MTSCTTPPAGWSCTRAAGHDGPCAAVPTPSTQKPTPPPYWNENGKLGSSLSFEGGNLSINIAGYGDRDGNGTIAFPGRDMEMDDEDYYVIGLPNSELIAIRDHLNKWFPAA